MCILLRDNFEILSNLVTRREFLIFVSQLWLYKFYLSYYTNLFGFISMQSEENEQALLNSFFQRMDDCKITVLICGKINAECHTFRRIVSYGLVELYACAVNRLPTVRSGFPNTSFR